MIKNMNCYNNYYPRLTFNMTHEKIAKIGEKYILILI